MANFKPLLEEKSLTIDTGSIEKTCERRDAIVVKEILFATISVIEKFVKYEIKKDDVSQILKYILVIFCNDLSFNSNQIKRILQTHTNRIISWQIEFKFNLDSNTLKKSPMTTFYLVISSWGDRLISDIQQTVVTITTVTEKYHNETETYKTLKNRKTEE